MSTSCRNRRITYDQQQRQDAEGVRPLSPSPLSVSLHSLSFTLLVHSHAVFAPAHPSSLCRLSVCRRRRPSVFPRRRSLPPVIFNTFVVLSALHAARTHSSRAAILLASLALPLFPLSFPFPVLSPLLSSFVRPLLPSPSVVSLRLFSSHAPRSPPPPGPLIVPRAHRYPGCMQRAPASVTPAVALSSLAAASRHLHSSLTHPLSPPSLSR